MNTFESNILLIWIVYANVCAYALCLFLSTTEWHILTVHIIVCIHKVDRIQSLYSLCQQNNIAFIRESFVDWFSFKTFQTRKRNCLHLHIQSLKRKFSEFQAHFIDVYELDVCMKYRLKLNLNSKR